VCVRTPELSDCGYVRSLRTMAMSDVMDSSVGDDGFAEVGELSGKVPSGTMGGGAASARPTLDEPVMDTLRRDLRAIAVKVSWLPTCSSTGQQVV
jgi:hypothetical protein